MLYNLITHLKLADEKQDHNHCIDEKNDKSAFRLPNPTPWARRFVKCSKCFLEVGDRWAEIRILEKSVKEKGL